MIIEDHKLLTTDEVAGILRLSSATIRQYCREGVIRGAVKCGGSPQGNWRIPSSWVFGKPEKDLPKKTTWTPLQDQDISNAPIFPGNYAIYIHKKKSLELFYIGTTTCLQKRLKCHPVIKTLNALGQVFYIKHKIILNGKEREEMEAKLIARLKPISNGPPTGKARLFL